MAGDSPERDWQLNPNTQIFSWSVEDIVVARATRSMVLTKFAKALVGACITGAALMGGQAMTQSNPATKTVLELFTSQGCSSCPAADALLEKYSKRSDILALSVPVDYWDYLGWKDTLALPENSKRQRQYAKLRGDNQIYTPQIVVDGVEHAVGSNPWQIDSAIQRATEKLAKVRTTLRMTVEGDNYVIEVGQAQQTSPNKAGIIHLAIIKKSETVAIGRGENGGRTVTYFNVVRNLRAVGNWVGDKLVIRIPRSELKIAADEFCAALLQQGPSGPIIAAADVKNF